MARKVYDNGVYEGELRNGKRHGKGKMTWSFGSSYDGYWENDIQKGQGIFIDDRASGSYDTYEGTWLDNGEVNAKVNYANGNSYNGKCKCNYGYAISRHGKGELTYKNGAVFDGTWNIDQRDGLGKYTDINKIVVVGKWKNDRIISGEIIFLDGTKRDFTSADKINYSKGIINLDKNNLNRKQDDSYTSSSFSKDNDDVISKSIKYPNGDTYRGELRNNKRHGMGEYKYATGAVYYGEWKNDKKDGIGTFNTIDGDIIEAKWKCDEIILIDPAYDESEKNEFSSIGIINYLDGSRRKLRSTDQIDYTKGILLENEKSINNLNIKVNYADSSTLKQDKNPFQEYKMGDNYKGDAINLLPNGEGKCTFVNGDSYEGSWVKGKFSGYGTYTFKNGESYVGEWENNKQNGIGTYTYKNGDSFLGEWKNNKKHGMGRLIKSDGSIYKGTWENNKEISTEKTN